MKSATGEIWMKKTAAKTSGRWRTDADSCRHTTFETARRSGLSQRPTAVLRRCSCHRNIDGARTGTLRDACSFFGRAVRRGGPEDKEPAPLASYPDRKSVV